MREQIEREAYERAAAVCDARAARERTYVSVWEGRMDTYASAVVADVAVSIRALAPSPTVAAEPDRERVEIAGSQLAALVEAAIEAAKLSDWIDPEAGAGGQSARAMASMLRTVIADLVPAAQARDERIRSDARDEIRDRWDAEIGAVVDMATGLKDAFRDFGTRGPPDMPWAGGLFARYAEDVSAAREEGRAEALAAQPSAERAYSRAEVLAYGERVRWKCDGHGVTDADLALLLDAGGT